MDEYIEYSLWIGIAVLLGATLLAFGGTYVGVIGVTLFFYYAARPVRERVESVVDSRTISTAVAITVVVLPVALLLSYTTLVGLQELGQFARQSSTSSLARLISLFIDESSLPSVVEVSVQQITQNPQQFISSTSLNITQSVLKTVAGYAGSLSVVVVQAFVSVSSTFYLLRDDGRLTSYLKSIFDPSRTTLRFFTEVDTRLQYVFFGNVLNAVITGIIGTVVFSAVSWILPPAASIGYPVLIGLLCGLASLIPVVGMKIVYIPVTLSLSITSITSPTVGIESPLLFLGVAAIVVDVIPDIFLRPVVSGQDTHTGLLMLAYITGPLFFGWYGFFIGPAVLVLSTSFIETVVADWLTDTPTPRRTTLDDFAPTSRNAEQPKK